jgi:GNAT superfamily N-acetyltransferase
MAEITPMPDLLVNLLKVPAFEPALAKLDHGIIVRRAQAFEISAVRTFVVQNFSTTWADEISVGFARQPVSVYIATLNKEIVGFAAYECTRRDFFGPTGVSEPMQGRGIGKALLLACLWGLRELGYVYAIIGGSGPNGFYEKAVGATVIPDSNPGIYTDLLR